jgi:transposase
MDANLEAMLERAAERGAERAIRKLFERDNLDQLRKLLAEVDEADAPTLTRKDVAKRRKVHVHTVDTWVRTGKLKKYGAGRAGRFKLKEVDNLSPDDGGAA